MTAQRRIIHEIINTSEKHLTADEIYISARERLPGIAIGTVYRNLGLMCEAAEIRRIANPDGPDHYDKSIVPHDHMLCSRCRKLVDIKIGDLTSLIEERGGVKVTSYELSVYGLCSDCKDE